MKRLTKWFMADTNRHLRTIVAIAVIGMLILVASGILLSLKWPANWNPMLGSLILNIIASLISVMLAILTAIFIVERYLERRRREAEEKAALEQSRYEAQWKIYAYGGIAVLSWLLIQISLFVAYGKNQYVELARRDTKEVPDSISDFISALNKRLKTEVEASEDTSIRHDEKDEGWTQEYAIRLKKAFREMTPRKIQPTRKDLTVLVTDLERLDVFLHDQISIFQPFMARHMGVGVTLVELGRWLRRSIDEVNSILALGMLERESVGKLVLDENFTSLFCSLGELSVTLRQVISAGPKDIEVVVNGLGEKHRTN